MNFKKWVKIIQTAGYNGACTVVGVGPSDMIDMAINLVRKSVRIRFSTWGKKKFKNIVASALKSYMDKVKKNLEVFYWVEIGYKWYLKFNIDFLCN